MTKNARRQDAAIARNPRTTITAIAQCGNAKLEEADCTRPPGEEEVGALVWLDVREAADNEDANAAEAEDAEAEDAEAAEEEEAAMTESANVVWTAEKVD